MSPLAGKQCRRCRFAAICSVGGKAWVLAHVHDLLWYLLEDARTVLGLLDSPCGIYKELTDFADSRKPYGASVLDVQVYLRRRIKEEEQNAR